MNILKATETTVPQDSGGKSLTGTQVSNKFALDVNVVGGGGGGGGGDTIITDDTAQRLSLQDVAGVKKIPVVADVILTPTDDGVHIGSKTTGNLLEPNADGSINIQSATVESLLSEIRGLCEIIQSMALAIQRQQPQIDTFNRPMMRLNAIDSNLTLTALTNLNNFSGGNTSGLPYQLSNSFHIYNNITVTP